MSQEEDEEVVRPMRVSLNFEMIGKCIFIFMLFPLLAFRLFCFNDAGCGDAAAAARDDDDDNDHCFVLHAM